MKVFEADFFPLPFGDRYLQAIQPRPLQPLRLRYFICAYPAFRVRAR